MALLLGDAPRDGGHIYMYVTALRAMAKCVVHHYQGQKRLSDGCGTNTHTWIMTPFGDHLNSLAVLVN
jgi:hypothetical protein